MKQIISSIRNSGLFLFSILVCLALLELYLNHAQTREHALLQLKYTDRDLCTTHSSNPLLIYTYIPNKCGANSRGYLDAEHELRKPVSNYRIIVIGDSVAQGQGVHIKDSFGKVLERKLNTSRDYPHAEVILLARSGYSTSQQLSLLKDEAFEYNPDLIIWSYVLNDPAHPVFHNANGELGKFFFEPRLHIWYLLKKILFIGNEKINGRNCDSEFHSLLHCIYADQVRSHIREIGLAARAAGIPILFAIHPVFEENKDFSDYSFISLHNSLSQLATEAGLDPIDLLPPYLKYTPDMLHQEGYSDNWWDPWHPNRLGHSIIANYLFKVIIEKQLINPVTDKRTRL